MTQRPFQTEPSPPQPLSRDSSRRKTQKWRTWWLVLRDPGLVAYNLVALLGAPLFLWRKWRPYRHLQQDFHFDPARWKIRFDDEPTPQAEAQNSNPSRKNGPRVMFITLGWGEVVSVEPLARALQRERPGTQLLFAVRNREAIVAASVLSDSEVFPLPFDSSWPVARWIDRAQPDLVVFYERFGFTALLRSLWLARIPFVILHARMRHSESRSRLNLVYKHWQLRGLLDLCLANEKELRGVQQLLPPGARLHVTGSIKFPHSPAQIAPERESVLRHWIEKASADAPLLVAGSTDTTEEDFVLDAFEQVRRELPADATAPVLLLAPRHVSRGDDVANLVQARGFRLARRSQSQTHSDAALPSDVLLLDTLGELAVAYRFGVGSFVGGTVYGDSHNVAEPLMWGIPVAYGPRRGNFSSEQQICEAAGVGFRVSSAQELALHWMQLLESPELREDLREKVGVLVESQRPAFQRVLDVLLAAVDVVVAGEDWPDSLASRNDEAAERAIDRL